MAHHSTAQGTIAEARYCHGNVITSGVCPDCGELPTRTLTEAAASYQADVAGDDLVERLIAARDIAAGNGRVDLVAACDLKITFLRRGGYNPSHVAGVVALERDCITAITMADIRANYARFKDTSRSPAACETAGVCPRTPAVSERKAA